MSDNERDLSRYIDSLNEGKKPKEHGLTDNNREMDDIYETVRRVRSLKDPVMPDNGYTEKLAQNIAGELRKNHRTKKVRMTWFVSMAAVAAVVVLALIVNFVLPANKDNIVYAMEQAFKQIKAYHGVLEIAQMNADGQKSTQGKLEIWSDNENRYYVKELIGAQSGLITANNGEKKWQLRPDQKEAYIFSAFPDPYRFTFELGKEVDEIKNALKFEAIGEERVSGRMTKVLKVYPQGGAPYKLWVDKETKLPLKKQSAMQNALQYTVVYTKIEFIEAIPKELITYSTPSGFSEVNKKYEQIVSNLIEAEEIVGFTPRMPEILPLGYSNYNTAVDTEIKAVKFNYTAIDNAKNILILENKVNKEFVPVSTAVLGKIGNNTAEVQSPIQEDWGVLGGLGPYAGITDLKSIRWQNEGMEYAIIGNDSLEVMIEFIKSLKMGDVQIPVNEAKTLLKPQVEVPVNMDIEENEQKSVDSGHSPWKLDPVFVAQVFVSLKISPEGIHGDYPIKYEELKIMQNTGIEAIIEVNDTKTSISKVFLKKLIRKDNTGIWSVVGYDVKK